MLEHLKIKNYAHIENLTIDFSEGFNVITGETGSGKSIILGALGLLMGEKADASSIRSGAEEIVVNAIVSIPENHEIIPWLKEHDIEIEDGQILIRRTVKLNGRSVISVQGQLLTRQELTYLADSVIDMHGQSEHQSLLVPDKQRKIVDSYAQSDELLKKCSDLCHRITELKKQKEEIENQIAEGKRQEDYLKFSLEEIESVKPQIGEDIELKDKISLISQFEAVYESLQNTNDKLKEVRSLLFDASSFCTKASKLDSNLVDYVARIESSRIEADDIAEGLRDYLSKVDYSEEAINQMQERLSILQKLKRKFGPELNDVLLFAEKARETLDITTNSELHLDKCQKELDDSIHSYEEISSKLSEIRHRSATELEGKIEETLRTLGMPNAKFSIKVEPIEEKISVHGSDSIVFIISANPGEPLKEMKEIVSGGELSRIMLALKTVLAKADSIQTQVFDEVDSGIGGSIALSLANCISDLARTKQVIAITHLAAIASKAKSQFVVSKSVENERTYTHLKEVTGEDRVREIARMLSGDESEITLSHARSLLS